MSYELLDESGKAYYAYHSDRDLCDDPECPCTLPSTPQRAAQRRADDRAEWSYFLAGYAWPGMMPEAEARERVDALLKNGLRAKLLRVVEDYGR